MKKTITLYSLDIDEYPNIDIEVDIIDDIVSQIDLVSDGKTISAIKKSNIKARRAKVGEIVDTRPRIELGGRFYVFTETRRVVSQEEENNGAMIVVNPDGEEYLIDTFIQFCREYKKIRSGYISIDGVETFVRSNGNYIFKTAWGEDQVVLKDSYFRIKNKNDIYSITNVAFNKTYTTNPKQIQNLVDKIRQIKYN